MHNSPSPPDFYNTTAPSIHQSDLTWVTSSETGQVTDIKPLEYQYLQSLFILISMYQQRLQE